MLDNENEPDIEIEEDEEEVIQETKESESEVEEDTRDDDEEDDVEDEEEDVEEDEEDEIEQYEEEDGISMNGAEETKINKSSINSAKESSDYDENYQPYKDSSESDTSDSDYSDSEDEYVSKVDLEKKIAYIKNTHTQEITKTYEEMISLTKIKRRKLRTGGEDIIDDENHKTVPILTKYEKTRILGIRVSQLNEGAPRYINVNETIIDNNIIAEKELKLKKLPFIVTRPLPNGEKEHWRLKDLEIL